MGFGFVLFGFGCFVVEVFLLIFGVFGFGGIVVFMIGVLMLIDIDVFGYGILWFVIVSLVFGGVLFVVGVLSVVLCVWCCLVVMGVEVMFGSIGEVFDDGL